MTRCKIAMHMQSSNLWQKCSVQLTSHITSRSMIEIAAHFKRMQSPCVWYKPPWHVKFRRNRLPPCHCPPWKVAHLPRASPSKSSPSLPSWKQGNSLVKSTSDNSNTSPIITKQVCSGDLNSKRSWDKVCLWKWCTHLKQIIKFESKRSDQNVRPQTHICFAPYTPVNASADMVLIEKLCRSISVFWLSPPSEQGSEVDLVKWPLASTFQVHPPVDLDNWHV